MEIYLAASFLIWMTIRECYACINNGESHTPLSIEDSKKATTSVYLECVCVDSEVTTNLKWLDIDSREIESLRPGPKPEMYTERQDSRISLHIPSLSKTMSGTYKCVNDYNNGSYYEIQQYTVDVYEPPIIHAAKKQFISLGKDSLVKCEAYSDSSLMTTWHKRKEDLVQIFSDNKYDIIADGLLIRNVAQDDAGSYSCSVLDTTHGDGVDSSITVQVMIEPKIEHLVTTPERPLIVGDALTIECIADGVPYPNFVWRKVTNLKPTDNNSTTWVVVHNRIIFENITADDQGTYECVAKSFAGEAKQQIVIEVLVPPQITEFSNKTVAEGSVAQLVCNAIGRPTPNISIIYVGKDENEEQRETTEEDVFNNLSFITVTTSYEGYYMCIASNEINFVTKRMYLAVLKKPYFIEPNETIWGWNGKKVSFSCQSEANPKPTVNWKYRGNNEQSIEDFNAKRQLLDRLNNQTDNYLDVDITNSTQLYGVYECTARNDLGEATKIIYFEEGFVPPAINNASGLATATSATFQIIGPNYMIGPPILGYTCEYDEVINYGITNIHKNRTWSIDRELKLDKLKPQTTYNIKFAAQNEVGIGPWSATFTFTTLKPSTPNPPVWEVDNSVVNVSDLNQVVKWKTADDNGEPIDYYTLKYCQNCDMSDESCKKLNVKPTNKLEMNTNILNSNTTYCVELLAHNYMGDSVAANITVNVAALVTENLPSLSAGGVIGIAIVVVLLALFILDAFLLMWKRQGIIASCYYKKNKKRNDDNLQTRDKKGLLRSNCESATDSDFNKAEAKHKEFEYNKTTGIITGKNSAV